MKKIYLLVFTLACFQFAKAQNPVPNPSFENWTSGSPDDWFTDNINGYGLPITQVSPGNSGLYAAKGEVLLATNDTILAPFLNASSDTGYGFVITQNYTDFQFFFKTNLLNGDVFIASVSILDSTATPIGGGDISITVNDSVFTQMDVPITYMSTNPVATASIIFSVVRGTNNLTIGSYFIVDDVSLSGLTTGMEQLNAESKLQVFPVPAHDLLTIRGATDNNKPMQFVLIDAIGKVVMEKKSEEPSNNFMDAELNVQGLAPGFYSLMMITDEKTQMRRIIVQ